MTVIKGQISMRKFFLIITISLLCISHVSFAISHTTKSSSKSTKHHTIHTATKHVIAKKTVTKTKTTQHKIHSASTKSSKLHSKKSIKMATRHRRHTTAQIKSFNPEPEESNTNLTEVDTPTFTSEESAEESETTSAKKTDFHLLGWGKNNDANDDYATPKHVTAFAHKTVTTLHYSSYRFGGNRFDLQRGIYMLDCSGYVDNLLNKSAPRAYSTLAQWSGSYKPNSEHYYNFFNRIANQGGYDSWDVVENTKALQPGDILVFRYKNGRGKSRGGHVMLVMGKQLIENSDVVKVRVADSAETGHSADTRGSHSGIGIGTLLLKINPNTGRPYAFAWRMNSPWNTRVNIAMGRPVDA